MRRFLYISPYFPPDGRVGALRPLKFVRHLGAHGWEPVVLADFHPGAAGAPELAAAVPAGVAVHFDYGWWAAAAARAWWGAARGSGPAACPPAPLAAPSGAIRRFGAAVGRWLERLVQNPELVPLGEHLIDLPHAHEAARRVFARSRCEAIVVNADPFAALLVGRSLARETGAPLVADLRDPWAPCELRRPLRPAPQRAVVDALERSVVEASSYVVLNTEEARDAYRAHYADLEPARFVTIRNHADRALIGATSAADRAGSSPFELLYLGQLRRFVEGDTLTAALGELGRRGIGPTRLRLHVVGAVGAAVLERVRALGVGDQLQVSDAVPLGQIGAVMAAADLLVAESHAGRQRIPAKIYEYLASPRPLLVVTDNPELRSLLERAGGARWCARGDAAGVADRIEEALAGARRPDVVRRDLGLDSATASRRLAELLDRAVAGRAASSIEPVAEGHGRAGDSPCWARTCPRRGLR